MKASTKACATVILASGLTLAGATGMAGATTPTVVQEVGLYLYKKIDPTLPASWGNSGLQIFIVAQPGSEWFETFPGELPEGVCGPGWAVQSDEVSHDGSFVWPETIQYPNNVLSQLGVLVRAKHADLETLIAVPDCAPEPTPEPTPTPTVTPTPEPTPTTPLTELPNDPKIPTLAPTGLEGWFWSLLALAVGLTVVGWWAVRSSHDFSTTNDEGVQA